jgi:hypothetical protein
LCMRKIHEKIIKTTHNSNAAARQKCFVVFHAQGQDFDEEIKLIGVFSYKKLAATVVKNLKLQPGFCEFGRFSIDLYFVDKVEWSHGFVVVE